MIGQALDDQGDVQIYGCEVGQGNAGRAFVGALAAALGAPVAAYSAPVGHADLGGDWRLDVGEIRSPVLHRPQWHGLLGLTIAVLPQTIPGRTAGEVRNSGAFAALRSDGSVVTWGSSSSGGDSGAVAAELHHVVSMANPYTNDVWIALDGPIDSAVVVAALDGRQAEGDHGDTVFNFEVSRVWGLDQASTLDFAVTGSGAAPADAADFGGLLPAGSVSFAPGESRQVISIHVAADRMAEQDEGFTLRLANPVAAVIAIGAARATIRNDDTNVSVAALDPDQSEGDSGATAYTFTLTRSGVLDRVSTVDYRVIGSGDAPADAVDFGGSLPAGTVTFVPGETSKQITVHVAGDTRVEADEGFALQLSYQRGASLGVDTASAVIRSDDTQPTV